MENTSYAHWDRRLLHSDYGIGGEYKTADRICMAQSKYSAIYNEIKVSTKEEHTHTDGFFLHLHTWVRT